MFKPSLCLSREASFSITNKQTIIFSCCYWSFGPLPSYSRKWPEANPIKLHLVISLMYLSFPVYLFNKLYKPLQSPFHHFNVISLSNAPPTMMPDPDSCSRLITRALISLQFPHVLVWCYGAVIITVTRSRVEKKMFILHKTTIYHRGKPRQETPDRPGACMKWRPRFSPLICLHSPGPST